MAGKRNKRNAGGLCPVCQERECEVTKPGYFRATCGVCRGKSEPRVVPAQMTYASMLEALKPSEYELSGIEYAARQIIVWRDVKRGHGPKAWFILEERASSEKRHVKLMDAAIALANEMSAPRKCIDCGVGAVTKHPPAVRCNECQAVARQNRWRTAA